VLRLLHAIKTCTKWAPTD